jgi:hypothetical protein
MKQTFDKSSAARAMDSRCESILKTCAVHVRFLPLFDRDAKFGEDSGPLMTHKRRCCVIESRMEDTTWRRRMSNDCSTTHSPSPSSR